MSERCTTCGVLSDPCFCSYSDRSIYAELKRRGYIVKVYQNIDAEVDLDY